MTAFVIHWCIIALYLYGNARVVTKVILNLLPCLQYSIETAAGCPDT